MTARETWPSIDAFYDDEHQPSPQLRRRSVEHDFGSAWIEGDRADEPRWRVTLVVATGELVAVCLAVPEWCEYGGQVWRLGRFTASTHQRMVQFLVAELSGWSDRCGQPFGLTWVRQQVRRLQQVRHQS